MQVAGLARRSSRAFRAPFSLFPKLLINDETPSPSPNFPPISSRQCHSLSIFSLQNLRIPEWQHQKCMLAFTAPFCSRAEVVEGSPTEAVSELYGKILESVKVKRSAPPNAWLWSLIEKCRNKDDIKLLFDILQHLRIFRLSNLRIHDNFNCNLCLEVAKACSRVGAIDFGKKTLWKHNKYGLSPTIRSANQLLSYAKMHRDPKLMVEVMKLLKRNDLPLQPATADVVFSICYDTDNWELISKYSQRFLKAEVKLRRTTFATWMEFAANRGDTESLWKIEKLRSDLYKQHTLKSGFSCAKSISSFCLSLQGFVLEQKPDAAAAIIQVLYQILPDSKRPEMMVELQKLVSEWPSEVIKHQKEDRKALYAALQANIPAMISSLLSMGVAVSVNTEDFRRTEALLS
ncbi:hypothetical protein Ancab_030535 [Ancistrocladus abbreviatus]